MKFGTFITTYNRPAELQNSLTVLARQTRQPDLIVVVDNGSTRDAREIAGRHPNVAYLDTGTNLGSAGGAAAGTSYLYDAGFDLIHLVDDDDPPRTDDTIERLIGLANRHAGPRFGGAAAAGTCWDWQRGLAVRYQNDELKGDLRVENIGGGMQFTVHRRVVDEIGPANAEHFFGFWDGLYSMRIHQAGFELWVDSDLLWRYRQDAGRQDHQTRRSAIPRDSPQAVWRRYYVTRNYIHDMRSVFVRPDLARREAARAAFRSAMSWSRGPRYGASYSRHQLRGVLDGYRSRLGRTVRPVPKPGVD